MILLTSLMVRSGPLCQADQHGVSDPLEDLPAVQKRMGQKFLDDLLAPFFTARFRRGKGTGST